MTETEAQETLRQARSHQPYLVPALRIVEYPVKGGYAVAARVPGFDDLYYVLTDYHVNILRICMHLLARRMWCA